jgi:hypothetical protein
VPMPIRYRCNNDNRRTGSGYGFFPWLVILVTALNPLTVHAGTVSGAIQLVATGRGVANGTLTFTLSQPAVVSGTATVVTTPVNCYTDGSGNVVGLPNPLVAPVLSRNGSGSLPAGTYFVRYTWGSGGNETMPSPEASFNMPQPGSLIVSVPANPPANATQWNIYIGTAANAETLQDTVNAPFSSDVRSVNLAGGAALPASNNTACSLRFNDELQPSFTGYMVTLVTATGATVPGFPQKWYLSGGTSGIVNVSAGTPLYLGTVVYPQAIVATPTANAQQSIAGPLNLGVYALNAGALVDQSGIPAQLGVVRTGNNVCAISSRNAAANGDVCAVQVDGANVVNLGGPVGAKLAGPITNYNGVATADFGVPIIVGTPIHVTGQTANLGVTNLYAAPITGMYFFRAQCRTTTSGTGTTASFTFTWSDESGTKSYTSSTWALNSVALAGTTSVTFPQHINSGSPVQFSTSGTFGTSVYACDAWLLRES